MKKITTLFLALTCLTTSLYANNYSEKEGLEAVEQVRREIAAEQAAKERAEEIANTVVYLEELESEETKENEKARMNAIEEVRREIAAKQAAEEAAKKESLKSLKADKDYKKIVREPLDQRVFRTENTFKDKFEASEKAFEIGYERMYDIREGEAALTETLKSLGEKPNSNRKLLSVEFDRVQKEALAKRNRIKQLRNENTKLEEYLAKLDDMERKIIETTSK